LSDKGVVVGSARRALTDGEAIAARAFAAREGRVRDLGTLGGPYSHAFGINGRGQIVGKADLAPRPRWVGPALGLPPVATHAFLWEAGKRIDRVLPPSRSSVIAVRETRIRSTSTTKVV
jgi:uncharacterized membrane protein